MAFSGRSFQSFLLLFIFLAADSLGEVNITARFLSSDITLEIKEHGLVELELNGTINEPVHLFFTYQESREPQRQEDEQIIVPISDLILHPDRLTSRRKNITLIGNSAGHVSLGVNSTDQNFVYDVRVYCRIGVMRNRVLNYVGIVVGWMYFIAWTISFYPQVILNCRRRCVVGLNFDFIAYNILGFFAYSCFNVGLFWIPTIQALYFDKYPRGVNPVQLNDVVFSLHALAISTLTGLQCLCFTRGGQRVSKVAIGILTLLFLFILVSLIITLEHVVSWLDYLYYFSYVKLFITLIKYVPQAYMNFRRKSTEGWAIGNVLLDFTGGSLSIVQMFIIAYNFHDWDSIFGNPTKFGLGAFSVMFDILFIIQHYVCYRLSGHAVSVQYEERTSLLYEEP